MQVDRVRATIRYSQDTGKGAWRALEIGAEANLDPGETMDEAQAELYANLRNQFMVFWNTPKHSEADVQLPLPAKGQPKPEPAPEPEPDQEPDVHWCDDHGQEFKRREKNGRAWYSHYLGDGQYCNESR